jgi:hypothetical protein
MCVGLILFANYPEYDFFIYINVYMCELALQHLYASY